MNVLVLRALGLGDLLTAVPALRALRDAFRAADISLACPSWLHELVDHWRLADETIDVAPLQPIPRAERVDLGVNLHGRGPESTRILLATGPRRLVAFRHPDVPETASLPEWRAHEPETARWCRLLSSCGVPATPDRLELRPPRAVAGYEGVTVLHPGASAPSRRWPRSRWAAVARAELAAGRRVAITGSADERTLGLALASSAGVPQTDVLSGRTSPLELASLVGAAGLVVSGDTGVAHLATALGTPSVVLFGPVPPSEWGPPPDRLAHRALWAGTRGDPHARAPDPGLLRLTPERVLAEIDDLRATAGGPPR